MHEFDTKVDEIRAINRTIDSLLDAGLLRIQKMNGTDFVDENDAPVGVRPLYESPDFCVMQGKFPKRSGVIETHRHNECREYFIVTKGTLAIDFGGGVKRVLHPRECAAVQENQEHRCIALEDDTEYVIVCIPVDDGIQSLFDRVYKESCCERIDESRTTDHD